MSIPTYYIRPKYGHYEAVDNAGRIVCTGDTRTEVEEDIIDMIKNMVGGLQLENSNGTRVCTSARNAS